MEEKGEQTFLSDILNGRCIYVSNRNAVIRTGE